MASPQPFQGKVIAITGAASGMGRALAHYVVARGASVSLSDVQQKQLDEVVSSVQKIAPSNSHVISQAIDVRNPTQVNTWIASTITHFKKLDCAANLAGVFANQKMGLADMTDEEWEFVLGVNLTGVMNCLRAELRVIAEGGSIVNASSVAGLKGSAEYAAYTASKHGVIGLTKCAAREAGGRGVRVNCICPGPIATPMMQKVKEIVKNDTLSTSPLAINREGTPEEIAALIGYLFGDESRFTTGAEFKIDGGMVA